MEEFIREFSNETIALLFGLSKYGIKSRAFMLMEHKKILEEIWLNDDKYKSYSVEHKQLIEARTYVELIERTCQLIEDFCCYSFSLWSNVNEFPQRIVQQPNPKNILKKFDNDKWNTLLRYSDLNSLVITSDEKDLVFNIRKRNIEVLNNYLKIMGKFLDLYWKFYNKHKHGNPLIYGFNTFEIDGEPSIFIPAAYNSKKIFEMTGIIMNRSMYKKLIVLFGEIYKITGEILDTTIKYIQRSGKLFILNATYCKIYPEHQKIIDKIIKEYDSSTIFHNVELIINVDRQEDKIKKHLDFYNNLNTRAFDDYQIC